MYVCGEEQSPNAVSKTRFLLFYDPILPVCNVLTTERVQQYGFSPSPVGLHRDSPTRQKVSLCVSGRLGERSIGFVCQLLAHIIIKGRFKMAAWFRLIEVCILSGWSILLRECLMLVVIKENPVYGCRVFRQ